MNPLALLPWWVKALVAAGLALLLVAAVRHYNEGLRDEGRQEVRAEYQAQALAQAERNRELQRAAEKRYVVQAEARERVITETIVEVRHAAESLAACPVPEPARRLLNRAAECAREDRPASCGPGDGLQPAE